MLIHHGGGYQEAATKAADRARIMMTEEIESGKSSAFATVHKVMTEIPTDRVVKATALNFTTEETSNQIIVKMGDQNPLYIGRNALEQFCGRADVPMAMYRKLVDNHSTDGWGPGLMAHIFNEMYDNMGDRKSFLARSYDTQLRGWLSTSYRRLDSRPLLDAFLGATKAVGMIPIKGYASDTRVTMKSLLPKVFEPAENEVVSFGASWENSDYGNGAHNIRVFVLRLFCTNYAIADEGIRQIHLGKRLGENISFSQATYDLDTAASASAINDIVNGSLSPERIQAMCGAIEEAASEQIKDPGKFLERMKSSLTKGEREHITAKFNTPDVQLLPPGNTTWRMSNAISLFANEVEDSERKVELMKIAGTVIPALAEAA
jgi:hypothetical protein